MSKDQKKYLANLYRTGYSPSGYTRAREKGKGKQYHNYYKRKLELQQQQQRLQQLAQRNKFLNKAKANKTTTLPTFSYSFNVAQNREKAKSQYKQFNKHGVSKKDKVSFRDIVKPIINYFTSTGTGRNHGVDNTYEQVRKAKRKSKLYEKTADYFAETEYDRIVSGKGFSKDYKDIVNKLNSYFNEDKEEYSIYNGPDDGKELAEWYKNNRVTLKRLNTTTGKKEIVHTWRYGSEAPPVYDKEGNKIDISDIWDKYVAFDYYSNEKGEYDYSHPVYYAGTDHNAVDSLLDVLRTPYGDDSFTDYVKGYFINPLLQGNYKALMLNTLVNIGETLDFAGVGARAALAGRAVLGGAHQNDFGSNGNVVWYDSSEQGKQNQRKLMDLQADLLLTKGEGYFKRAGMSKDVIRQRIIDAGLWEDYKLLRKAYKSAKSDQFNKVVNNVKSAYTDPASNFHLDTGNIVTDIAGEIVLDPSLVVGGFAKAGASGGAKAVVKGAVESSIKEFLPKSITVSPQLNKAIDHFSSKAGSSLFTGSRKSIDDSVSAFTKTLFDSDLIHTMRSASGDVLGDEHLANKISQLIKNEVDTTNFKVLQSVHGVDKVIDTVDTTLLKATLPVPFVVVKGAKVADKIYRTSVVKALQANHKKVFGKSMSKAALEKLGTFDVSDLEMLNAKMMSEPSYVDDVFTQTIDKATRLNNLMNSYVADVIDGRLSYEAFNTSVDEAVKGMTGVESRKELEAYIDDLMANPLKENSARYSQLYNSLKDNLDAINHVDEILLKKQTDILAGRLSKVADLEELKELAAVYVTRTASDNYPVELENLIRAKADELIAKANGDSVLVDSSVSDAIVRDFERNHNTTLSLVDREIEIPKTVSDNTKFATHIDEALFPEIDAIKAVVMSEGFGEVYKGSYGKLRNYFFRISNYKNMDPEGLFNALQAAIRDSYILKGKALTISSGSVPVEDSLILSMINLSDELKKGLRTVVGEDTRLHKLKIDNYALFEEYMFDSRFREFIGYLRAVDDNGNPSNAFSEILRDIKNDSFALEGSNSAPELLKAFYKLSNMLDMLDAFSSFRNELASGITDHRLLYLIIDTLFGITKGSPNNYLNNSFPSVESFMNKLDTIVHTEYGTRCSLDGARRLFRNLDPDLFKGFEDEIKDPTIQKRLFALTESGHLNPVNDVNVQMLYVILKDRKIISDYNIKVKTGQPVVFLDIETTGLNRNASEITGIGCKRWKEDVIDESATLKQILDFIDGCDEKYIVRNMSDEDIDKIDNSYFENLFSDSPDVVQNRDGWVKAYKEYFSHSGGIIGEDNLLHTFNQYVDELSGDTHAIPCFVSHSQYGFDLPFIITRVGENNKLLQLDNISSESVKTIDYFGKSSKHTTDVIRASENTLARIKGLENDVLPTFEEREHIQDCLTTFANNIKNHCSNDFRIIDPRDVLSCVSDIRKLSTLDNVIDEGLGFAEDTGYETLEEIIADVRRTWAKNSFDRVLKNKLTNEISSENFDKLLASLDGCCASVGYTRRVYDRYVFGDPYFYNAELQTQRVFSNVLVDYSKADPSRGFPIFGSDVYFDSTITRRCFDVPADASILGPVLQKMYLFAKSIDYTLNHDVTNIAYSLVKDSKEDCVEFIEDIQEFASQLPYYHSLYYLNYIKAPENALEAYVIAEKLSSLLFKEDKSSIFYFETKGLGIDVNDLFTKNRKAFVRTPDIFKSAKGISLEYIDRFRSANYEKVKQYKSLKYKIQNRLGLLASSAFLNKFSNFSRSRIAAVSEAYSHINSIISTFDSHANDYIFWKVYNEMLSEAFSKRYKLFSAFRMSKLIESEDSLISELAFSNGFRRVISLDSKDSTHINLVKSLENKLKTYDKTLFSVSYERNNKYLVLQLNKEPLLFKDADGVEHIKFAGIDKVYERNSESKISFPDFSELKAHKYADVLELPELYNTIIKLYDQIDLLTDGASVGTMGILHRYGAEYEICNSFSSSTVAKSLGSDFTMNERFWHGFVFDKSMLGDFDSCYKIGVTADEFDFVLNAAKVLDEISGRVKATEHYLDTFFGENSEFTVSSLFSYGFTKEELLDFFLNNPDTVICRLVEDANTETGYSVRQIVVKDSLSIEEASLTHSIFVPYDMYLDLVSNINESAITNNFLKAWLKFVHLGKVAMLTSFGTLIRNWVDATTKNAGEEGSLMKALSYEFIAAKRIREATNFSRRYGEVKTEFDWNAIPNKKTDMSFADYQHICQFMADSSVSGGQAFRAKQIVKEWEASGRVNKVLSKDGFNTVGSNKERLEYKSVDEVLNWCNDAELFNPNLFDNLSKDSFIKVFEIRKTNPNVVLDPETNYYYELICDYLVSNKAKTSYLEGDTNRAYQKITNFMLTPMSQTELIVRYSLLLALEDMGLSRAGAYHSIVKVHTNYNDKPLRMKLLEAVVPFATFQWNNLAYWLRQVDQNPRMLRYIEHTYGRLSFQDVDDIQDERGVVDQSKLYQVLSGGLPLGSGGMYFKLNPSYMDALNWFYGGPSSALSKIVPSLQLPIRAAMQYSGMDSWNIFSDVDFAKSQDEWMQDVVESVPVIREIYLKYQHFMDNQNWQYIEGNGIQKTLSKYLPSMFGVVKSYQEQGMTDFDNWQKELAKDGKWYDSNIGHVVDISQYNEDGLNDPNLSFDERRQLMWLERGMLYDANVGHYVMPTHFSEGGLNRNWDFSIEGEWDEYQDLRLKYFGEVYDLNIRKFVKKDKLSEGGLNADNTDWDTVCELNAQIGLYWDSNQNMFVKKKYLTTGGLNSDNISFSDLCSLKLALHGKKWVGNEFVKVAEPSVVCMFDGNYEDWKMFGLLGFNTAMVTPEHLTVMGRDGILRNLKGQYVLSSNEVSNEKIYAILRDGFSYSTYGRSSRRYNYHSGWSDGYWHTKTPIVPYRSGNLSLIKRKSGLTSFNRPYTSSSNYSAFRMSISGYKNYDDYYSFEYKYNYNYRNPVRNNSLKRYDYRYHNTKF